MLPDPLTLKGLNFTGSQTVAGVITSASTVAVTDVSPGRTVRKGFVPNLPAPATLTISHTVSNENKPVKTDRHLVRLDAKLSSDASNVNKGDLTASCYVVITVPHGAVDTNGAEYDAYYMLSALIGFLTVNPSTGNLDARATLNRLLSGEP